MNIREAGVVARAKLIMDDISACKRYRMYLTGDEKLLILEAAEIIREASVAEARTTAEPKPTVAPESATEASESVVDLAALIRAQEIKAAERDAPSWRR